MMTSLGLSLFGGGAGSAVRSASRQMQKAESYAEWRSAAQRYDRLTGQDRWREEDTSPHYDHALIRRRLDELLRLRAGGEDSKLLFALNEGIHGNLGNMGRSVLYRQSAFGTKQLIVDYVDAVVEALEHLAVEESSGISRAAKRNFFRRASLCYGHTALMLSGSGTFFFFHIGVLRALLQEGLLPAILSGSSGGAAVAAMVGTRRPEDQLSVLTVDTFHHFIQNRRRTVPTSIHRKVIQKQQELLDEMLPDYTFEEAFETSGMAINVSIAPTDLHQSSRLLNAITSPHVCVRESVMASSAIPGIFPAVTLMAKSVDGQRQPYLPDRQWVDGSVSDDLPAKRLARLFGVNHYIVSQTNPHVLPFVTDANLDVGPLSVLRRTSQRTLRELLNGSAAMVLPSLTGRRRLTQTANMLLSVLNQDYLGDINILPPQPAMNPFRVLAYRSEDEAREMIRTGERATWPHLERIRIQTKVSRTLDRILATL